MTPDQVALVRSSWPRVSATVDELTAAFYSRLFEIDVSAARLFAGVDMTAQRTKLAQALAVIVHALDDPDALLPALAVIGRRHACYGVEDRHFDSVGEALLWALAETGGHEFTPEARAAWASAYALAVSVMRRAINHSCGSGRSPARRYI